MWHESCQEGHSARLEKLVIWDGGRIHKLLPNESLIRLPLLLWNLIFMCQLAETGFGSDEGVSRWLLYGESGSRFLAFSFPIFLPLWVDGSLAQLGSTLWLGGSIFFFASWLPILSYPGLSWSGIRVGVLAPYVTPLLVFLGVAILGSSQIYLVVSLAFTVLHGLHGGLSLEAAN